MDPLSDPGAPQAPPADETPVSDEQRARRREHLRAISGGGALLLLGILAQNALRYAVSIAIGRSLGPAVLGDYALLTAVERDGQVIAEAGAGRSILKFVPAALAEDDRPQARRVVTISVAVSAVSGLLSFAALWLLAPVLAEGVYRHPELTVPLRVAAAFVPFAALAATLVAVPQAERNPVPLIVVTQVGVPGLLLGAVWLIGRAQGTLTDLMWAGFWTVAIGAVGAAVWAWRWTRTWRGTPRRPVALGPLLHYAIAIWVTGCAQLILGTADLLVLRRYVPAAELGAYAAAARTAAFLILPLGALGPLVGPVASDLWVRRDLEGLRQVYRATTRWITGAAFGLAAPLILAPGLVMKVFGKGFEDGGAILLAVAIGQLINASTGNVGQVLAMVGQERMLAISTGLAAAALIAALIWASPLYGALGAAVCVGVVFALLNLFRVAWLWRYTGLHPYDARLLGCSLASGVGLALAGAIAWDRGLEWRAGAIGVYWLGQAALARYGWVPGSARVLDAVRAFRRRDPG